MPFDFDLCVVGGCGRVGLPLALCFAEAGLRVSVHDINDKAVAQVNRKELPFQEEGAQVVLDRVVGSNLTVANEPELITRSAAVVVVIGWCVGQRLEYAALGWRRHRGPAVRRSLETIYIILSEDHTLDRAISPLGICVAGPEVASQYRYIKLC